MNLFDSKTDLSLVLLVVMAIHSVVSRHCLDNKCDCVYQNNKLTADCSDRKLGGLAKSEESADVQSINLTRTDVFELRRNIFSDSNFVNLQKIYIQRVALEVIDENAFHKLSNLIELDLSLNALKDIPSPSFHSIPKLRILDLSSNKIQSINNHSFLNLTNLKSLSLERNQINFIADNAFKGLERLETLKLSENHLSYIRSQTLLPLIRVHSLTLSENPWRCDCALKSVRKYLLANSRINVVDVPTCTTNQQVWTQMGLDSFQCPPVISNLSLSSNTKVSEGSTLRLECGVQLNEEDDSHLTSVQWYWNTVTIFNNSKGCGRDCSVDNQIQYFLITENINKAKKLKVSRLELSSVQTFNSGSYGCVAKNNAGTAQKLFKVDILGQYTPRKITTASASSESYTNTGSQTREDHTGDNIVLGLILAVVFGILFVIILLGISIVLFCRRRQRKHPNERNDDLDDGTELEKLTDNSNLSLKVNPIQKPPRMTFEKYNSDKDIPQVWLIKHNMNGNSNLMNDQSYAESDYSTQLLFNDNYDSHIYSDAIIEPDVVHPSAYVRERHIQVTDLDKLSVHSDGTEV